MAEITITRALSELKTLQSRYERSLRDLDLVAVKQGSKLRNPRTHMKEEDFKEKAISGLQSSDALYNRIIEIKTAIDKSNSITKIKIGNKEMTIQEALVYKKYIELKRSKLSRLQRLAAAAREDFAQAITENNKAVELMISGSVGKETTDAQKQASRKDAEDYIEKAKKVDLVDPCEVDKLVKALDYEITEFETNIDYALSESNSTTHIVLTD
jgi:6-phosphofructokinase